MMIFTTLQQRLPTVHPRLLLPRPTVAWSLTTSALHLCKVGFRCVLAKFGVPMLLSCEDPRAGVARAIGFFADTWQSWMCI